jgi:alpha-galactosidase
LWSKDAPIYLGRSTKHGWPWEGWFKWSQLSSGFTAVNRDLGLGMDHPYFILRNEATEEYAFAELAWPVNYTFQFNNENGLTFKCGPSVVNALRVMAAGETISTPAVHFGFTPGGFDASVQAMHAHVRRSVLPVRKPELAYQSQYLIPEDWPITVYRGKDFNEENMKKCIDLSAALGLEGFIVDGPCWGSSYGNWLVPNQERFPNGMGPLVEYAHRKGLIF